MSNRNWAVLSVLRISRPHSGLSRATASILVIVAIGLWHPAAAASQQSPRRLVHIDVEGATSLDNLVTRATLIIQGRVTQTAQSLYRAGAFVVPTLTHSVDVIEVLKTGTTTTPAALTLTQPGGVAIVDGVEVYVDDRAFPYLHASEEYILFLSQAASRDTWSVVAGANGVLRIASQGRIATSRQVAPDLRTNSSLTVAAVKAAIAKRVRRQQIF